jgi:hypothetical protein
MICDVSVSSMVTAEDFFGAHDEFYDVEAHGGMLADGGFELRSNDPIMPR